MDIGDYLKKIENTDVELVAFETLKAEDDILIKYHQDQMLHGEAYDRKIGRYSKTNLKDQVPGYSGMVYGAAKHLINDFPGKWNVDLRLTGAFQNAITTQWWKSSREFGFFSKDWKNTILTKWYGKDIFGLSVEYRENLLDENSELLQTLFIKKADL